VPEDLASGEESTRRRRRTSRLLEHFRTVDQLNKSSPEPDRTAAWHAVVAAQVANSQLSSPCGLTNAILEDPLMHVGVGNVRREKKSPIARFRAAVGMARDCKRASSYLAKAAPLAPKAASPLKAAWRRSPKLLKAKRAEREAAREREVAEKEARWTAAVRTNIVSLARSVLSPVVSALSPSTSAGDAHKERIDWAGLAAQGDDALDEFMQLPAARAEVPSVERAPPQRSDLQAMCMARRRQVMLEMGVGSEELHPTLRGYSAPRTDVAAPDAVVDSLDAFMRPGSRQ